MDRVEELVTVRASTARMLDVLLGTENLRRWVAPDVAAIPLTHASRLGPGDHFRIHVLGALVFEYTLEAVSDREVVLAFTGPWSGSERWSFIADGAETIVRRVHEVHGGPHLVVTLHGGSLLGALAWNAVGRVAVLAHFKLELSRFRDLAEREPGIRAEIEAPAPRESSSGEPEPPSFPVDDG